MTRELLNELLKLSPAEQIELAHDLWDSVEAEEMPPLTTEQMQEAERRYVDLLRHPEKASSWEEVKARLSVRHGSEGTAGSQREPT